MKYDAIMRKLTMSIVSVMILHTESKWEGGRVIERKGTEIILCMSVLAIIQ